MTIIFGEVIGEVDPGPAQRAADDAPEASREDDGREELDVHALERALRLRARRRGRLVAD